MDKTYQLLFGAFNDEERTPQMDTLLSQFSAQEIQNVVSLSENLGSLYHESGDFRILAAETALKAQVGIQDAMKYAFLHRLPKETLKNTLLQMKSAVEGFGFLKPFDISLLSFRQSDYYLYVRLMREIVETGDTPIETLLALLDFPHLGESYLAECCVRLMAFQVLGFNPSLCEDLSHRLGSVVAKNQAAYLKANDWRENIRLAAQLLEEGKGLSDEHLPDEAFHAVFLGIIQPEKVTHMIRGILSANRRYVRGENPALIKNFFKYVLQYGFSQGMEDDEYFQHFNLEKADPYMAFYLTHPRINPNFSPAHIRTLANTQMGDYYNAPMFCLTEPSKPLGLLS